MTNEELLQKGNIDVLTGGLMPAEAADKFLQTTVDQSSFLKNIRIEKEIVNQRHLDNIGVDSRLFYASSEGIAPTAQQVKGITAARRTLTVKEITLPFNIGMEWLRKNIAGNKAEGQIQNEFAKQFSNDIVDLSINGNTGSGLPFTSIADGFFKLAQSDVSAHFFEREMSDDWKDVIFPNLLTALPEKWKQSPENLAFFVSYTDENTYRKQLASRISGLGDVYLTEGKKCYYQGIEVIPVYSMPTGYCMLTLKKNLAAGFGRDIEVYKTINPRASLIEYTIKASIAFNYVISDAISYCI